MKIYRIKPFMAMELSTQHVLYWQYSSSRVRSASSWDVTQFFTTSRTIVNASLPHSPSSTHHSLTHYSQRITISRSVFINSQQVMMNQLQLYIQRNISNRLVDMYIDTYGTRLPPLACAAPPPEDVTQFSVPPGEEGTT